MIVSFPLHILSTTSYRVIVLFASLIKYDLKTYEGSMLCSPLFTHSDLPFVKVQASFC